MTTHHKILYVLTALMCLAINVWSINTSAANKVALVIGNKNYPDKKLDNPINDANDIRDALSQVGFKVLYATDADYQTIENKVRDFIGKLDKDSVGVFYYSGHGAQADNSNFLIPVGADIRSKAELKHHAYDVGILLDELKEVGNALNIVILDACRNNPYRGFRGGESGLATMSGAKGTLIAYATAPGAVASDNGNERNGLYTKYLKHYLVQPGLSVEEMLKNVADEVNRTDNEQTPWYNSSITGAPFCFAGCSGVKPPHDPEQPTINVELAFWDSVKNSQDAADFQAYLDKYPAGEFAVLAQNKIKALSQLPVPVVDNRPKPPEPVVRREETRCADCPDMVAIPAGEFYMGSYSTDSDSQEDEKPRHSVYIQAFKLGRHEVTRQQFAKFVDDTGYRAGSSCYTLVNKNWAEHSGYNWQNPGFSQANNHPAVCINVDDASAYIAWLNRKSNQRYRLPTEAEWEYAARARSTTIRYWGNNADDACRYANVADETVASQIDSSWIIHHCSDGYAYTAPVGSFLANDFSLYDMLGNVWEWTCSAYNGNEKICNNDANSRRVFRGGSWGDAPALVRSATRSWNSPSHRYYTLGFRLAQDN